MNITQKLHKLILDAANNRHQKKLPASVLDAWVLLPTIIQLKNQKEIMQYASAQKENRLYKKRVSYCQQQNMNNE